MSQPSYTRFASWYDALYDARSKDYGREADAVLEVAAELGVEPSSVLDVACGTGRHLEAIAPRVEEAVGVDASEDMLALARRRLDGSVLLSVGDFRSFDLGREFDLVTCLFSSIGHVEDAADLDAAVARMAQHVAPGGLLLIEPWLTPQAVREGHVDLVTARTGDGVVARAASSYADGDALVLRFAWAVAGPGGDVATAEEDLRMPLFSAERYQAAVTAAGLDAQWRDEVPALDVGRGLLIGRRSEGDDR